MPTLLSINNYNYLRGGAESVFLSQNNMLREVGWAVIPFCMQHPKNNPSEWGEYFVEEIEYGSDYPIARKVRAAAKAIYSLEARSKLEKLIKETKPDLGHVHNIYHHISPSILALIKAQGLPLVMTVHDLKLACPAYTMMTSDGLCERCKGGKLHNVVVHRCVKASRRMSSLVLVESVLHKFLGSYEKNIDRFVVPSRFYIKKLEEWGIDVSRFVYLPNFVDEARLRSAKVPRERAFVYFGRLSREKGVETLLRAASIADVPLWIVGTGPLENTLKRQAQELNVEVTFRGYLKGETLKSVIASAWAAVLPSEWYENAPLSLMESYSLGTPVIGANIGGIPELIKDGDTGLNFESGSVEGLASALQIMRKKSEQEVRDMGERGSLWMKREFSVEVYQERLLNLYSELGVG